MRGLTASVVGLIGLGVLISAMGACSDSTDMGNSGGASGAGGASAGAHNGGGPSAGSSAAEAGAAGASPAGMCPFLSDGCQSCLLTKCGALALACNADSGCKESAGTLPNCACDQANSTDTCLGAFVAEGGDPATALAECFTLNCTSACE